MVRGTPTSQPIRDVQHRTPPHKGRHCSMAVVSGANARPTPTLMHVLVTSHFAGGEPGAYTTHRPSVLASARSSSYGQSVALCHGIVTSDDRCSWPAGPCVFSVGLSSAQTQTSIPCEGDRMVRGTPTLQPVQDTSSRKAYRRRFQPRCTLTCLSILYWCAAQGDHPTLTLNPPSCQLFDR